MSRTIKVYPKFGTWHIDITESGLKYDADAAVQDTGISMIWGDKKMREIMAAEFAGMKYTISVKPYPH